MNIETQSKKKKLKSIHHIIDGAISGFAAGISLQPLQVIKTAMQIKPIEQSTKTRSELLHEEKQKLKNRTGKYDMLSFREATKVIFEREGFRGYFRGFVPSIIKATLSSGTFFGVLTCTKNFLNHFTEDRKQINFYSAIFARLVQAFVTNPAYVVKTRFEVVGFNEYKSVLDAVTKIYQIEGMRGFTVGLKVGCMRDVPFTGIYYPIYEEAKNLYASLLGMQKLSDDNHNKKFDLAVLTTIASWSANIVSCMITHPLDIIRTRILFQFHNTHKDQVYNNVTDAFLKIYKNDGLFGFFRGMTPRVIRKGTASAIAWNTYEFLVNHRKRPSLQ